MKQNSTLLNEEISKIKKMMSLSGDVATPERFKYNVQSSNVDFK
jgi:hypothetical protein